jgi:hypothetical protein
MLTMAQEKEWQPVTKLGRLVKAGKIKSMEEMYVQKNRRIDLDTDYWQLPPLSSRQGVPDRRLLPPQAQG